MMPQPDDHLLTTVAARCGLLPDSVHLLRRSENHVYRASIQRDGREQPVVVRIRPLRERDTLAHELATLSSLAEGGVPVPTAYPIGDRGEYCQTVTQGDRTWVVSMLEFLPGSHSTEGNGFSFVTERKPGVAQLFEAGRALAGLHRASKALGLTPWPDARSEISPLEQLPSYATRFRMEYEGGEMFVNACEALCDWAMTQRVCSPTLLHLDYRYHNVLFVDERLTAILDFDVSGFGNPLRDVAFAASEWSFPDGAAEPWGDCYDAFLRGYELVNPIDRTALRQWTLVSYLVETFSYFQSRIDEGLPHARDMHSSYMFRKFLFFRDSQFPTR